MTIATTIVIKLTDALAPAHLEVINESLLHNVPPDAETHFKVIIVTAAFDGLSLVKRHREINRILADELSGGVHALGLHTLTLAEWSAKGGEVAQSPKCLGGSKVASNN